MDLIDRYMNAIRRNLPRDKADDIVAELRDGLASRGEEREAALGRPLHPDEIKALIKGFGHPLLVASRYRRQQWLIGPDAFPFYLSVLRIVLALLVAGFAIVLAVNLVLNGQALLPALGAALGGLWTSVLLNLAIVTLVFVALERSGFPAGHVRRWDPGELPAVSDPRPGPWEAAIEVALSAGFLIWWSGLVHIPYAGAGPTFRIEPAPVFTQLYWPIFALAAARLVHNLVHWLRPRWTSVRIVLAALTTIAGLALLVLIYRAGHWAVIVPTGMPAAEAAKLEASLNLALRIGIVAAAVAWSVQALQGIYRLWRRRGQLAPA